MASGDHATEEVVIVGAGPAGLAAAAELRRRAVDPLVVERGPSVATTWRGRHDHLSLNTHRWFSHQPGRRLPRSAGPFPSRDAYVAYLASCSEGLRIRFATDVRGIARGSEGWDLTSGEGVIVTRHVVIATGPDAEPVMPSWPGEDTFTGRILHSAELRTLADADGRSVLVVGPGNSGVDLLNHLQRRDTGELWLSARSGMNIAPARWFGVPLHPIAVAGRYLPVAVQDANLRVVQRLALGDLARYGYQRSSLGALSRVRLDDVAPAIDDGFVDALKSGRVQMRPGVERLDGERVVFVDGTSCRPDLVVCATGYRPGLESLVGALVELDALGRPPFTGATSSADHPGLWFFGLNRSPYGNMHIRRREARQLARRISADLSGRRRR